MSRSSSCRTPLAREQSLGPSHPRQPTPTQRTTKRVSTRVFFNPPIVYTDDQTGTVRRMESFGSSVAVTTQPGGKSDAVVSPDGQTVAYWRQSPAPEYASEIWMVGIDGTNERLVATVGVSMVPRVSWAPDSSKIVFSVFSGGKWKATVASAVGAPNPQLLIPR